MKQTFAAGLIMIVMILLLVGLYELLPALQGWIVFSAMAALAMVLGQGQGASEKAT